MIQLVFFHTLIQIRLDFHLPFADAMRFVPVDLSQTYPTIFELNLSNAFQLASPALAIHAFEKLQVAD